MPELESSQSAPAGRLSPGRLQNGRSRTYATSHPPLEHAFGFQHLDHVSNYHADHHDFPESDNNSEDANGLEKIRRVDEEAAMHGEEQQAEIQMGIRDTPESEATLEKSKTGRTVNSSRSARDPNLVWPLQATVCKTHSAG